MKNLHIILPIEIYKFKNEYYHSRTAFIDEIANHFNLKLHVLVKEVSRIDREKFVLCSEKIEFYSFFESLFFWHFIRNINKNKQKILSLPEDDLYLVAYPFRGISIAPAWILRKRKLVIWVKSDAVAIFKSFDLMFSNGVLKGIQRILINPFKLLLYIIVSIIIFKGNLIFYTANIVINKKNHINQYEIISCPVFNDRPEIVKKEFNYNICYIGGEGNQKGLSVLLKALNNESLKDKVTLNIIGLDKLEKEKNKRFAKNLKINFHGQVYERVKFYDILSQNDILVMPSLAEKQGKVQLEAMSAGVVPICSDSGGTYKTISNYYNGLLFMPGDHRQLCDRINLLFDDKDLYEDLKGNGLEYIKTLSLEKQAEKTSKIIKNFYKGD